MTTRATSSRLLSNMRSDRSVPLSRTGRGESVLRKLVGTRRDGQERPCVNSRSIVQLEEVLVLAHELPDGSGDAHEVLPP